MATEASSATTNSPVSGFQFEVYTLSNGVIDPIPRDKVGFTEVSGLTDETDAVEYKEGNDLYTDMLPGMTKPQELTLAKGTDRSNYLLSWRAFIKERYQLPGDDYRCTLIVAMYDRTGTAKSSGDGVSAELVRMWRFEKAWPRSLAQDDFNSTSSEINVERVILCYKGAPEIVFPQPSL